MDRRAALDPALARRLRRLGHGLRVSLQVGRDGLSGALRQAAGEALAARELIKVRFGHGFEGDPDRAAGQLAESLGAILVQRVGRVALLWKAAGDDSPRQSAPCASGPEQP